MGFPLLTC